MASDGYWAIWDDSEGGDYFDDSCGNPCLGRVDRGFPAESRDFHTDIWLDYYTPQYQQRFTEYVTLVYVGAGARGLVVRRGRHLTTPPSLRLGATPDARRTGSAPPAAPRRAPAATAHAPPRTARRRPSA